jgi:hypothetical protein
MAKTYDKELNRVEERLHSSIVQYLNGSRFQEDVESCIKHRVHRAIEARVEDLLDNDEIIQNLILSTVQVVFDRIRKAKLKKSAIDALVENFSIYYMANIEESLDELAAEKSSEDVAEIFGEAVQKLKLSVKKVE